MNRLTALLFGPFGSQAAVLLTGIIVARALGVDGRGEVSIAMLIPTLASIVGGLSSSQLGAILALNNPSAVVLPRLFRATIPITVTASLGAAIAIQLILSELILSLACFFVSIALVPFGQTVGILRGRGMYWKAAVLQVANPAAYAAALVIVGLTHGLSVGSVVLSWVISTLVVSIVAVGIALSDRTVESGRSAAVGEPWELEASEIRRRGAKSLLSTYSPLESFRVDQLVAYMYFGAAGLGLYVTALAFSNVSKLGGQALSSIVPRNSLRGAAYVRSRSLWSVVACIVAGLGASAIAPFLVVPLFGDEFEAAMPATFILCVAGGFMGARTVLVELFRLHNREGLATSGELSGVVVFAGGFLIVVLTAGGITAYSLCVLASSIVSLATLLAFTIFGDGFRGTVPST